MPARCSDVVHPPGCVGPLPSPALNLRNRAVAMPLRYMLMCKFGVPKPPETLRFIEFFAGVGDIYEKFVSEGIPSAKYDVLHEK
eukprot:2323299-Alexandrium_andersonii.AAC.1